MGKGSKKGGKPTVATAPWDHGTGTLAAMCGSDDAVSEFRDFLRDNPPVVRSGLEGDALARAKERALRVRGREFAAKSGLASESATFRDPDTGAQRNPNGVKRRRRRDQIEKLWREERLTDRQYDAAKDLRERFLATQGSAPAIKAVQVDEAPDFGAIQARRIDAISHFHALAKFVPSECTEAVSWVVLEDGAISANLIGNRGPAIEKRRLSLALGLDALADVREGLKRH